MSEIAEERSRFREEKLKPVFAKMDLDVPVSEEEEYIVEAYKMGESLVSGPVLIRRMTLEEERKWGGYPGSYLPMTKEIILHSDIEGMGKGYGLEDLDLQTVRHEIGHSRTMGTGFPVEDFLGDTFCELCADYYGLVTDPKDRLHRMGIRVTRVKFMERFIEEFRGEEIRGGAGKIWNKLDELAREKVGYKGKRVT